MIVKVIVCCWLAWATLGAAKKQKSSTENTIRWENIKVKYTVVSGGLYKIPLSVPSIKNNEFVYLEKHPEFTTASIFCYPDDPRVCPIYDQKRNIAGLRVAYIKDDLKTRGKGELPYSYDKPIFGEGSAYGKSFYYVDVLFVSPESLAAGGPATRDEPVGTGVYLRIEKDKWSEMPRKEADTKNTPFTKQACFPGMGMHYFYNMKPELDCHDHQPPFLLYDRGQLVGLGLVPFGSFSSTKTRTWFEDPPGGVIKTIAPTSPTCLKDWVNQYGVTSLHIFFKKCTRFTCVPFLGSILSRW